MYRIVLNGVALATSDRQIISANNICQYAKLAFFYNTYLSIGCV